ncbi:enoyl-CoA hydratase-related protein [Nocardioides sp. LHD-245]|uniref:enoyl-CoA hydratase-related protein n=1 Tax=Nocardioides sp. LHD-245 TaxID=3051387 RepID=UPI0027E0FE23|nr:enoyl-CoA hydratase-related protein [Nocardioides sp. LHD-245]
MTRELVERHDGEGGVRTLVLNRPDRRNAFDRALADALSRALDELDDDPRHRVGVLAANGPVFSAGTDLHEPSSPATERGGEYGVILRERRKPLVAAVEGPAFGGGFEIVLACDLVVASTEAAFGLPEVARGVVAACGGLFRTEDRLPAVLAMELALSAEPIDAERASAHGLVNRLCAPGLARSEAERLARRIARNSPAAVAATLTAIRTVRSAREGVGWAATGEAVAAMAQHPERAEGIAAFFERREPDWSRR